VTTSTPRRHRKTSALVGLSLIFLLTSHFASAQPKSDVARLIDQLHDKSPDVRRKAAYALQGIGPAAKDAVPELVKLLSDPDGEVRASAAYALQGIGPVVKEAIPELVKLLKDPEIYVQISGAVTLGHMGPAAKDAVFDLVKLLKDPAAPVRLAAAVALRRIGPVVKEAIPELVKLLSDSNVDARASATSLLGDLGPTAKETIPELARLLKDPDDGVRQSAAIALVRIAEKTVDTGEPDEASRRHLDDALKLLESRESHREGNSVTRIRRAVNHLKALERASLIGQVSGWVQTVSFKDWRPWAVILLAGWLAFLFAVFLVKPLWLPRWSESLKDQLSIKIKPTNAELSLGIPFSYVSLIRLFAYRRRVLDAWVKEHVERCRESFEALPTVEDRAVHVSSPVNVAGALVAEFSAATLRAHIGKSRHQCRWLIFGEGGVGKTSLACQMARWAMAPDKAHRLARHLVLPVLIEDELDNPATPAGLARFTEAIRGKLQALISSTEPISPDLLTHLLRRLRILVIVDHFTEMSQATRDQIRFDAPDFPAAALVVTARTDATLGNLPKHTIEPIRIQGTRLSVFIDAYLKVRKTRDGFKARDLFDDEEYFEACKQLSRMAGERDITVLLAKLYADQMVAAKESPDAEELPKTIPDLMLRYLSELNRNVGGEENRVVHRDCKAIAWECLKPTYRPRPAERTAVTEAMKGDGDDKQSIEARLDYLVNRLRVIQVTGTAEDHIGFVLDPLAEYLAGMEVVEKNRGDKTKWGRFLENADRKTGAPEAIRGLLLAVRDCCLASRYDVPDFVTEELGKRGGLDPEMVRQLHLKQRVRHHIANLGLPNAEDRRHAAGVLGELGPAAEAAIPELVKALSDPNGYVRAAAAEALGKLGPAAEAAIPELVKVLSDPEAMVRLALTRALGKLGHSAEAAIPELVKALSDSNGNVRAAAAEALGKLGPAAEAAIPELVKAHPPPAEPSRLTGQP
jgi:HEAT repeat protein